MIKKYSLSSSNILKKYSLSFPNILNKYSLDSETNEDITEILEEIGEEFNLSAREYNEYKILLTDILDD